MVSGAKATEGIFLSLYTTTATVKVFREKHDATRVSEHDEDMFLMNISAKWHNVDTERLLTMLFVCFPSDLLIATKAFILKM